MDRKTIINELRIQRKTYQEIGDILGITKQRVHQIYKDYVKTYQHIKAKVKDRDSYQCVICGSTENLEVHHINGIKKDNHLENLVTLCRKCHHKIEKLEKRVKKMKPIKFFKKKRIVKHCLYCKKEFSVTVSQQHRKYCSRECFGNAKRIYPNKEIKNKMRANLYYWKMKGDIKKSKYYSDYIEMKKNRICNLK